PRWARRTGKNPYCRGDGPVWWADSFTSVMPTGAFGPPVARGSGLLDPCLLNDFTPFAGFVFLESCQFVRGGGHWRRARLLVELLGGRALCGGRQHFMKLVDHLVGGAGGAIGGKPVPHFVTRHTGFSDGGNLGSQRGALRRGDAEGTQATALNLRQASGHVTDHHGDLTAQQIGDGHGVALVWNVEQLDASHLLQQLTRHPAA